MPSASGSVRALLAVGVLSLAGSTSSAQGLELSGAMVPLGRVRSFGLSPDGACAVFVADKEVAGKNEVYALAALGGGAVRKLSAPFTSPFRAQRALVTPDSQRVLYALFHNDLQDLYSVPIDGSAPAGLLVSSALEPWLVTSDGARVVTVAILGFDGPQLCSRRLAQPDPLVRLTSVENPYKAFRHLELAPDASRAVFIADQALDEVYELYSVPLDGSAPALRISATMVSGGDVDTAFARFRIAPDSTRAVYLADQDTDEVFELYSTPLDGSAPPVRLNPALVSGGDVSTFEIAPDSRHVVYRADQLFDGRFELYSAPLDGSGPVVPLSVSSSNSVDVGPHHISPDGLSVVYQQGQARRLHSIPIDGGSTPVALRPPDPGFLEDWLITPDSRRVVFLADALTPGVRELFSVPLDGSATPLRLNNPLLADGDVYAGDTEFEDPFCLVVPRTGRIVFRARAGGGAAFQLYSVAPDGSLPSVQESRDAALVQADHPYQVTADGKRLLYLAPSPSSGTSAALFLSFLTPPHRGAR